MAWWVLVVAGLFEVGWAVGLKYTEGFTRLWPSVGTVVAMTLSIVLLAYAMRTLPVGTADAVWTTLARSALSFSASSCSANRQLRFVSAASG